MDLGMEDDDDVDVSPDVVDTAESRDREDGDLVLEEEPDEKNTKTTTMPTKKKAPPSKVSECRALWS